MKVDKKKRKTKRKYFQIIFGIEFLGVETRSDKSEVTGQRNRSDPAGIIGMNSKYSR